MRLFIAEKPSLARAIADVLPTPHQKGEGFIRAGNGDVVSWCIGHLLEQVPPEGYGEHLKRWQWSTLPILPEQWQLQPRSKMRSQIAVLRRLIGEASELVHAGDPDREGQLLVDEVIDYLRVPAGKRQGMWRCLISDLNPPAVRKALAALRPNREFAALSCCALARSRADWLFGINLTRAYTLLAQSCGHAGLLSVGRVQTPVLGLVVRRDADIAAFVPHAYYEVRAHLQAADGETLTAMWQPSEACRRWQDDEGRVLSAALADNVVARIGGQPALVEEATRKPGRQPPPLPYNLSGLQMDAARQLGLSAQQTLDICQRLYEQHKLITYPRSDCRHLPRGHLAEREAVVAAIARQAAGLAGAVAQADLRLQSAAWNDSKVTAHHAIIPTSRSSTVNLAGSEAEVYRLIARQYLAQFYPPQTFEDTRLLVRIAGGLFLAKGRAVQQAGWRVLFPRKAEAREQATESGQEEPPRVPWFPAGTALHCQRGERLDKQTEPPRPFTEATLLAAMTGIARFVTDPALRAILRETDGLGTEATRAGIIELLVTRQYLCREQKNLRASATGQALIAALPAPLSQPDMTAQWEQALAGIEAGEVSYEAFMQPLQGALQALVHEASTGQGRVLAAWQACPPAAPAAKSRGRSRRGGTTRKRSAAERPAGAASTSSGTVSGKPARRRTRAAASSTGATGSSTGAAASSTGAAATPRRRRARVPS